MGRLLQHRLSASAGRLFLCLLRLNLFQLHRAEDLCKLDAQPLDEPTKGLDPVNRKLLLDIVDDLQQQGVAVIYITHLMEEVERLADRLLILKDGKARAYGTVDTVKKEFKSKSIEDIFVQIYKEKSTEVAHG